MPLFWLGIVVSLSIITWDILGRFRVVDGIMIVKAIAPLAAGLLLACVLLLLAMRGLADTANRS